MNWTEYFLLLLAFLHKLCLIYIFGSYFSYIYYGFSLSVTFNRKFCCRFNGLESLEECYASSPSWFQSVFLRCSVFIFVKLVSLGSNSSTIACWSLATLSTSYFVQSLTFSVGSIIMKEDCSWLCFRMSFQRRFMPYVRCIFSYIFFWIFANFHVDFDFLFIMLQYCANL